MAKIKFYVFAIFIFQITAGFLGVWDRSLYGDEIPSSYEQLLLEAITEEVENDELLQEILNWILSNYPPIDPATGDVIPPWESEDDPLIDPATGDVIPPWEYADDPLIDPATGDVIPPWEYADDPLVDPATGDVIPPWEYEAVYINDETGELSLSDSMTELLGVLQEYFGN